MKIKDIIDYWSYVFSMASPRQSVLLIVGLTFASIEIFLFLLTVGLMVYHTVIGTPTCFD